MRINIENYEFLATAATRFIYKRIFKRDLMQGLVSFTEATAAADQVPALDVIQELAFVMNKTAEMTAQEVLNQNQDDFLTWSSHFDSDFFLVHSKELIKCFLGNSATTSEAKN